jgi:hypothetical protein
MRLLKVIFLLGFLFWSCSFCLLIVLPHPMVTFVAATGGVCFSPAGEVVVGGFSSMMVGPPASRVHPTSSSHRHPSRAEQKLGQVARLARYGKMAGNYD